MAKKAATISLIDTFSEFKETKNILKEAEYFISSKE